MHLQETFITTSPHRHQNQVQVSQSITKKSRFNNSKDFQPPYQGQQESLWTENTCSSTDTKIFKKIPRKFVTFRPDEALSNQFRKINKQQKHYWCGKRLGTTIFGKTFSKQKSKTNKYVTGGKSPSGARDLRIVWRRVQSNKWTTLKASL